MSWLFGTPATGDWVTARRSIPVTFTDHLLGGDAGVKPGSVGVVTRTTGWNGLEVRFDGGIFGSVTARVSARDVSVIRRGGGVDAFAQRTSRLSAARFGVALAFVAPLAYFVVTWFIQGGSKNGLVLALLDSAIYGALDLLTYALANPVNAMVYIGVVSMAGRFAFRG